MWSHSDEGDGQRIQYGLGGWWRRGKMQISCGELVYLTCIPLRTIDESGRQFNHDAPLSLLYDRWLTGYMMQHIADLGMS